ncbi:MAG: DUF6516 family protein [bacterium]|nr:DUF6516 family protein [bacterium]
MYEIIDILNRSKIVSQTEILELVDEHSVQSIRIKTKLINESSLFIQETISAKGNKYSYHWQTKDNKLLLRWDNSPHYKEIGTFPHHKHVGENIETSHKVSIEEVLGCIEAVIKAE